MQGNRCLLFLDSARSVFPSLHSSASEGGSLLAFKILSVLVPSPSIALLQLARRDASSTDASVRLPSPEGHVCFSISTCFVVVLSSADGHELRSRELRRVGFHDLEHRRSKLDDECNHDADGQHGSSFDGDSHRFRFEQGRLVHVVPVHSLPLLLVVLSRRFDRRHPSDAHLGPPSTTPGSADGSLLRRRARATRRLHRRSRDGHHSPSSWWNVWVSRWLRKESVSVSSGRLPFQRCGRSGTGVGPTQWDTTRSWVQAVASQVDGDGDGDGGDAGGEEHERQTSCTACGGWKHLRWMRWIAKQARVRTDTKGTDHGSNRTQLSYP
mmetsp:Transcript_5321/g.33388  ORF Transcript_5321/g.33388 Transcript_5321/m.33388 type:complete len:325 (-) Transcript_5321:830-1804(-)